MNHPGNQNYVGRIEQPKNSSPYEVEKYLRAVARSAGSPAVAFYAEQMPGAFLGQGWNTED